MVRKERQCRHALVEGPGRMARKEGRGYTVYPIYTHVPPQVCLQYSIIMTSSLVIIIGHHYIIIASSRHHHHDQ